MPKLPWYSFLYRLLGAHGTFWLWIVTLAAIWWTGKPALIRALNREPKAVEVRAVPAAAREMTRWIEVNDAVLVQVDRRLFLADAAPTLPPVDLLLDAEDPAARWWVETRALADLAAGEEPVAPVTSGTDPGAAESLLYQRFARLDGRQEGLIAPERAILVQGDRVPPLSAPRAPRSGAREDAIDDLEAEVEAWTELVRARVIPGQEVKGLLADCPPTVRDRLEEELDVVVVPYILQAGREPRELESIVFGVASILLVFLAGGLWGVRRVSADASAEEEAAGSEPASAPA